MREEPVAELAGLLVILGLAKNVAVVQADEVVAGHVGSDPRLLVRGDEGLCDEKTLEGLGALGRCLHDASSICRSEAFIGLVGWIEPVDLVSLGELRDLWDRCEVLLAEAAFDWSLGQTLEMKLAVSGEKLTGSINGVTVLEASDSDLQNGAVGLIVEEGRTATEKVVVSPFSS